MRYSCLLSFLILLFINTSTAQVLPLTFEEVLEYAGASNPTIKSLTAKHNQAIARHKAAKAWWLPTIYAGVRAHQLNGAAMNSDGIFFLDVDRQNVWGGVGAQIDWNLGKSIYESKAAKQQAKAVGFMSIAERNKAILAIVHQYFDLQSGQLKVSALKQILLKAEDIVQQLQAHTDAGFTHKSDLLVAKSNLNHQKVVYQQAQVRLLQQSSTLAGSLYLDESTKVIIKDSVYAAVEMVPDSQLVLGSDVNTVLNLRPEYKAQIHQIAAAKEKRNIIAKGMLFPNLYMGVSNGEFGDIDSPTGREGVEIDKLHNTFDFNAALLWRFPLNDILGGGKRKIEQEQIKIEEYALQNMKYQVRTEVDNLTADIKVREENIVLAEESLKYAQEALTQTIERQKLRMAKAYEVFHAQRTYADAQNDYLDAIRNYNKSQYSLYVALGNNL